MIYFIVFCGVAIIAYLAFQPALKKRRRARIVSQPFQASWRNTLENAWPLYRRIPGSLKDHLHQRVQLFLAEKRFFGSQGFEVTEEVRLLIAAQACLVIINKPYTHFDVLKSVLVYPSAFITNREVYADEMIKGTDDRVLAGESWSTGKIIIAWDEAKRGMVDPEDGINVVIHEFAHVLDHENGSANGAPYLEPGQNVEEWAAILGEAFDELNQQVEAGQATLLGRYAATNPAEFFAVVSEVFFEQGGLLQEQFPALYQQFSQYYGVDPAIW